MADLLRIPIYLIRPEQIGCQPYRIIGIWFTLRHTWWWSICSVISSRHFPRNYCEWLWLRWQMWYMPDTYHQSHAMVESRRLLFINPPFFFFCFLPSFPEMQILQLHDEAWDMGGWGSKNVDYVLLLTSSHRYSQLIRIDRSRVTLQGYPSFRDSAVAWLAPFPIRQ